MPIGTDYRPQLAAMLDSTVGRAGEKLPFGTVNLGDGTGACLNANAAATATAAAGAGNTVVKASAGILTSVLVTATGTGTGVLNVYDNASTASGTIIGVIPANATAGAQYTFNMPAANGIVVANVTNGPALTVAYA